MQVSVPTHPGNSGGPLVTEEGFLAGVVLATAAPGRFLDASGTLPQNVNWGVRAEYVMALLERPLAASPLPTSREKAIERARAAVCLAIAHRR